MRIASVVVFAASLMLIAACETSSQDEGGGAGMGSGGASAGSAAGGGAERGAGGGLGGASGVEMRSLEALARELEEVGDTVYFGFDEYVLSPESRVVVERQATLLERSPSIGIRINGHTDERGTREYNLALGDRRANAVKDYLVALGIQPSRVTTVSYGEERPAVLGSTDSAWARNRRAVTEITSGQVGS